MYSRYTFPHYCAFESEASCDDTSLSAPAFEGASAFPARPSTSVAPTTATKMTPAPIKPAVERDSPRSAMENSAVNTGSPVRKSETVDEGRPVSATFWSAKVTHVLRIARNAITPQAAGSIVATSTTGSTTSAIAADSTKAARICVPAIVGADSF